MTKKTAAAADPKALAQRCIRYLHSAKGRRALADSNRRVEQFAQILKSMRPTKTTWDWTPTI